MAFDAGNIFQTYMQGAGFVANSLERAEAHRRQEEEDDLNRLAGKANAVFAPKYDAKGHVVPRTSVQVANDPQAIELMNDPRLKELRMQGITDPNVEDVEYVKAVDAGDGTSFVPVMRLKYKDGKVSEGPLTELRSNNPDDRITPLDLNSTYSHIAGLVYKRNPNVAHMMIQTANANALQGLRTQYRNETDPQNREALLQTAASYGFDPAALQVQSGAPIVQQDLRTGFKQVKDAAGNISYQRDPETAGLRGEVVSREQQEELAKRKAIQEQDFQVEGGQRGTRQGWREEDAFLDSATKQKLADLNLERELAREGKTRRTLAEIQNEIDNTYAEAKAKRDAYHTGVVADATAGAGLRNAPTAKKTHEVLNPVQAQDEEGLLKAREFFKAKPIEQVTQDDVLTQGKNLDRPGLLGLRAGLLARIERHDASAGRPLASVNALLNQSEGGGGGSSKAPAAPVFKKDELKGYLKDRVPDEVADSAALNGEVKFRKAVDTLGALGLPIPKDSVGSAIVNRVVGNEFILQHNGVLSDSGVDDAFPALWSWEAVARETNPNDAEDPAKAQAYVRDVFLPITQELKASGLPSTFEKSHAVALDVARLQKVGLGEKDAIREAIKLGKDPK